MKILSFVRIALMIGAVIAKPAGPDAGVNAILDKLNWYKAGSIIRDYDTKSDNETATKLSKYFADSGYDFKYQDLAEYLSQMKDLDADAIKANLMCQWAISKRFHPVVFHELWSNYIAQEPVQYGIRQFRTFVANPDRVEDNLEQHKGKVFEIPLKVNKMGWTRAEIKILLQELDWSDACVLINKYGYDHGHNQASKRALIDYFETMLGYDVREYLARMESRSFQNAQSLLRNLYCQWAIAKGFDPLVFLKLHINFTSGQNQEGNEYFKTFLQNPDHEKVEHFKDAIFPALNPEFTRLAILPCQTNPDKKANFFCKCTGCLLRETEDYQ